MAETNPDGGSSGGGSTTSICTVNPSDNVSIINNLISRISDIEKFLSQLVGADVHADNLSELAANIGNILNGTITLPSDGNSPYGPGGSIPVPDGFNGTVISGNVITTWTDGVVSFQVIPSSGVTVPTISSGGGATDHISVFKTTSTSFSAPFNFTSTLSSKGSELSWTGDKISCTGTGIYAINVAWAESVKASVEGVTSITVLIKKTSDNTTLNSVIFSDRIYSSSGTWSKAFSKLLIAKFDFPFYVQISAIQSSTVLDNYSGTISVTKLGT